MSAIHTIMVAIDFSKYSLPTAEYAVELANALGADLLFVHVLNQRDVDAVKNITATYTTFQFDQFLSDRMHERHNELAKLIQTCQADPDTCRSIIRVGVPYQALLEIIDEETPDLLIMATKGRSDLADMVMGSCARSMYRRSPIPLLSIRGDKFF